MWFYAPKANIAVLDGHVEYLLIGPYDHPGDYTLNTEEYVVDPDY